MNASRSALELCKCFDFSALIVKTPVFMDVSLHYPHKIQERRKWGA